MRRYKAVPRSLSVEQQCATRMLGDLQVAGMQGLARLDGGLAADPVIGPRLDRVVTSNAAGGQTWQGLSVVRLLVDLAIARAGGFDLDVLTRDSLTTQWAQMLRRPSDRMTVIVALHEFTASSVPFLLEPGLEIDELSEQEIAAALMLGAGHIGLSIDERTVSKVFGIRTSYESRLVVDGVPPEDQQETAIRESARQRGELVLLALRIFKAGRVGQSGRFEYTQSLDASFWPASGTFFGSSFGWHAAEPYVLADKELQHFREFWLAFDKIRGLPVISAALRRFSFAADRTLPDDEIVDLMIAAETLFLTEMGRQDRGELRFRLATRAASLLGTTLDERVRLFKFMRRAYDARSVIVHGGVPSEDDLQGLDGLPASIHKFADDLERALRETLQTAIRRLARGEPFPPDWEKLMFAGPTANAKP